MGSEMLEVDPSGGRFCQPVEHLTSFMSGGSNVFVNVESCEVSCEPRTESVNCDFLSSSGDTACASSDSEQPPAEYHEKFGLNLLDLLNLDIDFPQGEQDVSTAYENCELFEFVSPFGKVIKVFSECVEGTCSCIYYVGNNRNQLKPCRFASILKLGKLGGDPRFASLLDNVVDGFPIVDSDVPSYECENYNSILEENNRVEMDIIVSKELDEGVISLSEVKPTCIHSLGAVPKAGGGMRPITDCSRPQNESVNNFCETLFQEFKYKSVDDVVNLLHEGDFMAVIDIKSAYRAVSIREEHRKYMGFKWVLNGQEKTFVDNRMSFGLRLGPQYFDCISNLIYEAMIEFCGVRIINYLDDFIVISDSYKKCVKAQNTVISILRYLGFYVSFGKVSNPSQCALYLGLEIDSVKMELRLPEKKLQKLIALLDTYSDRKRISKHDIECLGGLLSHCAHVVKGGKVFCRRVYNLYKTIVRSGKKFVKLPGDVKGDLVWWRQFCRIFNGKSKINNQLYEFPMVSDSSLKGYGVYLGYDWVAGVWDSRDSFPLTSPCGHVGPVPTQDMYDASNINVLELWPIVIGLKRWCVLLRNKSLLTFTDNTQVMYMLTNGRSTNSTCMSWIRELFWICVIYNIEIIPRYINTNCNLVADTLSRVPYFNSNNELVEKLNGSDLCCLSDLFASHRDRVKRPEETSLPVSGGVS